MKPVLLSADHLCKSFANNGVQNHVLDNVSLEVYEGDFTVIMGSSGSGKSTLLYCLSGMDSITGGRVKYRENDITNLKEKQMARMRQKEFGFVFQQMHLVSNLTLFENVVVPGYLNHNIKASEVRKRAEMLFEKVNVSDAKDRLPSQVSGGEAQRAAIARAVIGGPGLLFADEPTGALNRRNTKDVLTLLTEMNEEGQSILMVTHDIHAAVHASRLVYLDDGSIRGEMKLPFYQESEEKTREAQINAWLSSMDW